FQAEDGIRDGHVTGVQTCALPISLSALATAGNAQNAYQGKFTLAVETHWEGVALPAGDYTFALPSNSAPYRLYIWGQGVGAIIRSEERRVGKECRSWWSAYCGKKK